MYNEITQWELNGIQWKNKNKIMSHDDDDVERRFL